MKGFLKALILVPLALIIVLLALANRQSVTISLDPFSATQPLYAFALPMWVLLFVTVTLGVIIGGVAAWLTQAKHRQAERTYRREARALRREVETQRGPARSTLPALPPAVTSARG